MATSTVQFFEASCSICMRHFANLAKNWNLAIFWLEPEFGRICKSGSFSARVGSEIRYSLICDKCHSWGVALWPKNM